MTSSRSWTTTLGFALLAAAHLHWTFLAIMGGIPVFVAVLAVEGLAFAAVAWRADLLRWGAAAALAMELAGILLLGIGGISLAFNLVIVVGLALLAWRKALAPGAYVAALGLILYAARDLMAGDTFLLAGLVLGIAGWSAVSWAAFVAREKEEAIGAEDARSSA